MPQGGWWLPSSSFTSCRGVRSLFIRALQLCLQQPHWRLAGNGSSSLWSRTFKDMSWNNFIRWFSPAFGYSDRKEAYVPLSPTSVGIIEEKAGKCYTGVPETNDIVCRSPYLFLSDGISMNFLNDCDFLSRTPWTELLQWCLNKQKMRWLLMVSFVSLTGVQHTQIDGKILFLGLLQVLGGNLSSGEHRQTHTVPLMSFLWKEKEILERERVFFGHVIHL